MNVRGASEPKYLSPLWWQSLAVIRTILALAFLAVGSAATRTLPWLVLAIASAFTIYSLLALLWRDVEQYWPPMLSLGIDVIIFLIFAHYSADQSLWFHSLFYVYLLLEAAIVHTWREVFAVLVLCQGCFLLIRPPHGDVLQPLVMLAGILACTLALEKRVLGDRLDDALFQIGLLRGEAEKIREIERQRIADDFHDGPLQSFISFQMRLNVVQQMLSRDLANGLKELQDLQTICRTQVAELRAFVRSMRPIEVEGESLSTAIRRLVENFRKDTGISASYSSQEVTGEPESFLEVLQIVRESLNNVHKHSKASRVAISLTKQGEMLHIEIEDDGTGFPFSGSYDLGEMESLRVGPGSIKRRVRSLGGDVVVSSRPGHGATLRVRVPL
ncbi:sensor histidine kinase [Bryobacter aggregatus]|uniref:sensor histidine kinase n=1 Tax=Bryobacter aggregatus TaxID=360054 RepID=UPI0004E142FE|nr:sensor histidine kinase [Bryobacter aggregatus]